MNQNKNKEIWIQRIKDFETSSLTQKAWCKNNGISVSTFRYWLKKLDHNAMDKPDNSSDGFEFASVSIAEDQSTPAMILEIKDVRLSITSDYDEILLLNLIKTLQKL